MATIATITIGGNDYTAYTTVAAADIYLATDPTRNAAWAALTVDQKGIYLVAATRRLDQLDWAGTKAGAADVQVNAWPRTGVSYADGTATTDTGVPQEVADATALLAGSIALAPATSNAGTSGSNQKRLKAGSAEIEYFRPVAGKALQDETVWAILRQFLAGSSVISGSTGNASSGTGADSTFADDYLGYGLDQGYS